MRSGGKRVILTEKMDGENSTLYTDYTHARSLDSVNHPSRNWLKQMWAEKVCGQIPENFRICGENLFAKHSIEYQNLESYFYGFSIWHDKVCISWDETVTWFKLLEIHSVPILYDGIFDEHLIRKMCEEMNSYTSEGAVLRLADSFQYDEFKYSVAKYVRKEHVQTEHHWMNKEIIANKLIK